MKISISYFAPLFSMLGLLACTAPQEQMVLPDPPETQAPAAEEGPYSVYSGDVGWDEIDLRVSEAGAEGQVIMFNVPYYTTRTNVENNFAMCAFSQYAILSGYSHFSVADTETDRNHVEVAFFVEAFQDPSELFEARFHRDEYSMAHALGRPCGFFAPDSGETVGEVMKKVWVQ